MALPTITVEIAFDQSVGTDRADLSWTDVTADIRVADPLTFARERAKVGEMPTAGFASVVLDNPDGDYTPGKTTGVQARVPIRVRADAGAGARDLWWGFVSDWEWDAGGGSARAVVRAADIVATVAGATVARGWIETLIRNTGGVAGVDLLHYYPFNDDAAAEHVASGLDDPRLLVHRQGASGDNATFAPGTEVGLSPDTADNTACALDTYGFTWTGSYGYNTGVIRLESGGPLDNTGWSPADDPPMKPYAFSLWFNSQDRDGWKDSTPTDDQWQYLFSVGKWDTPVNWVPAIEVWHRIPGSSSNDTTFEVVDGTASAYFEGPARRRDWWTHLFIVRDENQETWAGDRYRVWIDGAERAYISTPSGTPNSHLHTGGTARKWLVFGCEPDQIDNTEQYGFAGKLAHFAMFTADTVADLAELAPILADRGTIVGTHPGVGYSEDGGIWGTGDGFPWNDTVADWWTAHDWPPVKDYQTAALRFTRLAACASAPTLTSWVTADSTATAMVAAQAVKGKTLLDLAGAVAAVERGSVIATRDGYLRLQSSLSRLTGASPALTLDARTDILTLGGAFGVRADVPINRATVTTDPDTDEQDTVICDRTADATTATYREETFSSWTRDRVVAEAVGNSLVNRPLNPDPSAPTLTLSMERMEAAGYDDDLLTLELGDTIRVTNLPASAPATTIDLLVESVAHTVAAGGWTVVVGTSPGDGVGGVVGTSGTASTVATSLKVRP